MGIKRIVNTDFWNDDKVIDMFSPEDKLFMLYILTNPHTTQLGIYKINKKQMAFEIGYSKESIEVMLDRFQNTYRMIVYSDKTQEIAIKNYLKHSIIKGGKPVEDLLVKEINQVKDVTLLEFMFNNLYNYSNVNETVKSLFKFVKEKSSKKETNDNDNDNDNDVSYHDSCNDSSKPCKIKKNTYGTYNRIKLTENDYQKLLSELGQSKLDKQIELLDEYIESNNNKNKYSNFNLVLRKSIRENWFEKSTKPIKKSANNIIENNYDYDELERLEKEHIKKQIAKIQRKGEI